MNTAIRKVPHEALPRPCNIAVTVLINIKLAKKHRPPLIDIRDNVVKKYRRNSSTSVTEELVEL